MSLALEAHSPRDRVHYALKDLMDSGKLSPGQRIPSERQLAKLCNVARMTARAALLELEKQDVIKRAGAAWRMPESRGSWLMSSTVVVVGQERAPTEIVHSGQEWKVQSSAMRTIEDSGFHSLVLNPALSDKASFRRMLKEQPMGVLSTYNATEFLVKEGILAEEPDVPFVVYGDTPALTRFPRVVSDHYQGGADLVRWLVAKGRKRLLRAWSMTEKPPWLEQRNAGCVAAIQEAGLELLPEVCAPVIKVGSNHKNVDEFQHKARVMLGYLTEELRGPNRPDAIIATNDMEAGAIATACSLFGLDPSRDILISGYDNYWPDCPIRNVSLGGPAVTIDKDNHGVGEQLARMLIEVSAAGYNKTETPPRRIIPHRLVEFTS